MPWPVLSSLICPMKTSENNAVTVFFSPWSPVSLMQNLILLLRSWVSLSSSSVSSSSFWLPGHPQGSWQRCASTHACASRHRYTNIWITRVGGNQISQQLFRRAHLLNNYRITCMLNNLWTTDLATHFKAINIGPLICSNDGFTQSK